MCLEVDLLIPAECAKDEAFILRQIQRALSKRGVHCLPRDIRYTVAKTSLDARRRVAKQFMRCRVSVAGSSGEGETFSLLPVWHEARGDHSVVVVGAGPAGLFASLKLLEKGVRPIVVERGPRVEARVAALEAIKAGHISAACNVCFGEGGAGTFSDGKLFTTSGKRGDVQRFLATLAHFGADPSILTSSHPHIGSDKLPGIVRTIRSLIEERGGSFLFDTQVVNLLVDEEPAGKVVRGVRVESAAGQRELAADAVILSTGHSAVDVYRMIARVCPSCLQVKGFAMGVRVEHPRELIDSIQYGGKTNRAVLKEAARYKVTAQVDGRGVYSFCMCPGGYVIPAATAAGEVVVNGMSLASRSSPWSNAAFVVEVRAGDVPREYVELARDEGCAPMAALLWRGALEREAARQGLSEQVPADSIPDPLRLCCTAPAQRLVDFINGRESTLLPETSYAPGVVPSRLDEWLPPFIVSCLREGLCEADKAMKGFICHDALLIAPETRTSCPVRLLRDKTTGECVGLSRLYPAGEGSGWSGGITSSALDGIKAAERITLRLCAT